MMNIGTRRRIELGNLRNTLKREIFKTLVRLELLKRGWLSTGGPEGHPPTFHTTNGKKMIGIEAIPQRLHNRGIAVTQNALALEEVYFIVGVFTEDDISWLILTRDEMWEKCVGNLTGDGRYKFNIPKDLKGWSDYLDRWDKLEN